MASAASFTAAAVLAHANGGALHKDLPKEVAPRANLHLFRSQLLIKSLV